MKALAVYSKTANYGVEVLRIVFDVNDSGEWRYSNETRVRRSRVRYSTPGGAFRAGRIWISLNECLRSA